MRGHCWEYSKTWKPGKGYADRDGFAPYGVDPLAMNTRRLFAAWRDRAALAALLAASPQSNPAAGEPSAENLEQAPPNSLPDWSDCALRVSNSDYIAKRVAEGGYGAEPDSLLATELHRFIHEYDDSDPYRSAWFRHRLELLLNEVRAATPPASPAEVASLPDLYISGRSVCNLATGRVLGYIADGAPASGSPVTAAEASIEAGFRLVGKADFHMSAEMDVCIGEELFIRNPAAAVSPVPAFDASQPCILKTADPTRTYCERCKNPHHRCDQGSPVPAGVACPNAPHCPCFDIQGAQISPCWLTEGAATVRPEYQAAVDQELAEAEARYARKGASRGNLPMGWIVAVQMARDASPHRPISIQAGVILMVDALAATPPSAPPEAPSLRTMLEECASHIAAINGTSDPYYQRAAALLSAAPPNTAGGADHDGVTTHPEFGYDRDGELLIDWSPGKGRMVSMTLRADGRLSYAWIWDGEHAHGNAQMPARDAKDEQ